MPIRYDIKTGKFVSDETNRAIAELGDTSILIKGDKGDVGPRGEKGEKGDTGKDGKNGLDGKDGLNGKDGRDGRDGKDGKQGPIGLTGPEGPPGKDAIIPDSFYVGQAGGGGAKELKRLRDVNASALQNSNTLLYDSDSKKWVATTLIHSFAVPIYQPHLHRAVLQYPFVFKVDAEQFPNGVTVTKAELSTITDSTYSLGILSMNAPDDTGTTIGTVATSSNKNAIETLNVDVAAGNYIGLDLPATTIDYIKAQIYLTRK